MSHESENSEEEESIGKLIEEVEFVKLCKLRENNHIHHKHTELENPKEFYGAHKYVSVSEIFFDLVFVGVASNLAHSLRLGEQSWSGFFLYMIILLTFWKDYTMNQSLFSVGDFIDKLSAFFYGLGIIGCACTVFEGPAGEDGHPFGYAAIYVSICQLILNARGYYGMYHAIQHPEKPSHREESTEFNMKMQLVKSILIVAMWIPFACVGPEARKVLLYFEMLVPIMYDLALLLYLGDVKLDFSPNVHHFNERFEAIVLIMLGETVMGIIPDISRADEKHYKRTIGVIIMAYANMFLYKIFHFDVEEYEGHTHAVYIGGIRKFIWIHATILECVGIVLFGGSMGELVDGVMKDNQDAIAHIYKSNDMMAVGMSVALGANLVARLACKEKLADFQYAWELHMGQKVFQVITICLTIPLRHLFSEKTMLGHPWIRSLYVAILLFLLNLFFFIDDIFEYYHLLGIKERQEEENGGKISTEIVTHGKPHSTQEIEMQKECASKDISTTEPIEVKEKTVDEEEEEIL